MFRCIFGVTLFLLFITTTVSAATLIEIESNEDGRTQVITDGSQARINSSQDQSYVLIDYKKQSMYVVLPEQKQIMDMSGDMPSMAGKISSEIKMDVVPMGSGPDIAGYATKKFKLKANGKDCGFIYGSMDAMKVTGIAQLLQTMNKFEEKQRASMGSYADMTGPCKRAKMSLSTQAEVIGVPMLDVDKNGKKDNEVIRIDTNASLPAGVFSLPEGYKTISVADQMKQAKKAVNEMGKHQPGMEQMMKQMQQSGNIPPEAMEQMKRFQEMMKQQRK